MVSYYHQRSHGKLMIDFHTHCFPDSLSARAISLLSEAADIPPCTDGTVSGLRRSMDRAGVCFSVIQPIATKPSQTPSVNNWATEVQDDRILAFGTLHPRFEQWESEAERIKALGLRGVKFHPDYQDFWVDDESMIPIYKKLSELDLVILLHAGIDIGLPPPCHCPPERLARVVEAVPEARIVAAHMGGFRCWDDVERHLVGLNLFFDTSYTLGHMSDEQFCRILHNHGTDRCLFGTDSPWADQQAEIQKLTALDLSPAIRQAIMAENAKRLLRL